MRGLEANFINCLKSGFLSDITETVKKDPDLTLEIRANYINIYYKGNSLIKLKEKNSSLYEAEINEKFRKGISLPLDFTNKDRVDCFLNAIPLIKKNIIIHGKHSLEVEYEQMIIRANNFEPRNNTEYFIVDRQYTDNDGRFDLTGIFWEMNHQRKRNQEVPISLMEIKFALNTDIKDVHHQLDRYYNSISHRADKFAEEMQTIFRQKIELGLYQQPKDRLDALKTLIFSKNINQFQFILVLIDYNPYSKKLDLHNLSKLPFAKQIKIFNCGFAMWHQNMKPLLNIDATNDLQ